MTFGEKLQKLRKARDLTQEDLAGQIGVSRQALSKWESNAVLPDTENVLRLCDLFGVTADYLLRDAPADSRSPSGPDTAAPAAEASPEKLWSAKAMTIGGCAVSLLSLIGLLVMGILSSLGNYEVYYPTPVTPGTDSGEVACDLVKQGFPAFLEARHLEWLFWLLIFLAFLGILAVWLSRKKAKNV